MAYGWTDYQADREAMGFPVLVRLDDGAVRRRRKVLAIDGVERAPDEIAAIDAACTRLLAWVASGEAEPMPPARKRKAEAAAGNAAPPPKPGPAAPQPEVDSARRKLLGDQQERHRRRRGAYPHVRPTPQA